MESPCDDREILCASNGRSLGIGDVAGFSALATDGHARTTEIRRARGARGIVFAVCALRIARETVNKQFLLRYSNIRTRRYVRLGLGQNVLDHPLWVR